MRTIVSLQLSLFRNLAVGPVLLGLALLAVSLLTTRQLLRTFAAEMTGRVIAETETAFVEYLRPVEEIVELSLQYGRDGQFDARNPEQLDPLFSALLETVSQVSSVHVTEESGQSYMLLRNADGSYYNRIYAPNQPGTILVREWTGKPHPESLPSTRTEQSDYNPKSRVWFREALAALSAMNDREAIASELRALPEEMESRRAGRWEATLWDHPSHGGGGCFPIMFPVRPTGDGAWTLDVDDAGEGLLLMLVSTHLHGMQAARSAAALHAATRTLLRSATRAEPLLAAVRDELVAGASASAPLALTTAFLSSGRDRLDIAMDGQLAVLHRKAASKRVDWVAAPRETPPASIRHFQIDLTRGDSVILTNLDLFDLLNPARERFQPADFEVLVAQQAGKPAAATADGIAAGIKAFAGATLADTDLVVLVLAPAGDTRDPHPHPVA